MLIYLAVLSECVYVCLSKLQGNQLTPPNTERGGVCGGSYCLFFYSFYSFFYFCKGKKKEIEEDVESDEGEAEEGRRSVREGARGGGGSQAAARYAEGVKQ